MANPRPIRDFHKIPPLAERLVDRFLPPRVDPAHRSGEPLPPLLVVFAFPRTGSSALVRAYRAPDFKCAGEPFGPVDPHPWRHKFQLSENGGDIRRCLHRLWNRNYRLVKHIHSQLPAEHNERLLLTPGLRIVYLFRENLLENQLSLYIARKSGHWNSSEPYPHPVSIRKLSKLMESARRLDRRYRRLLSVSPADHLLISYEDIFQRGRRRLLFDFIGAPPANPAFLDPARKLKNRAFYRAIPNIHHVNSQLGSDHYGRLDLD